MNTSQIDPEGGLAARIRRHALGFLDVGIYRGRNAHVLAFLPNSREMMLGNSPTAHKSKFQNVRHLGSPFRLS